MDKLYLLEGNNPILIEKEIKNILKSKKNFEIIKYNLEERSINDVIETLDTYDMFERQKVVIVNNPLFYQNIVEDFPYDKFLKYLKNPSNNTLIIVTDKINNRLKIVKETITYFMYKKIDNINLNTYVKDSLKNFKIDLDTINYFLNTVGSDLGIIENELLKLKLFKIDEKVVEKKDIDLICRYNFENTIFDLIDAIIKKDKVKVIDLYNYFLENGSEVFQILVILANQIRLIYNVKILNKLSDREIAAILDVKEYPVKLARGKGYNYKKEELLLILYNLGLIDENIKSGKQIPSISLLPYILQI